jgi:hypothetical protein
VIHTHTHTHTHTHENTCTITEHFVGDDSLLNCGLYNKWLSYFYSFIVLWLIYKRLYLFSIFNLIRFYIIHIITTIMVINRPVTSQSVLVSFCICVCMLRTFHMSSVLCYGLGVICHWRIYLWEIWSPGQCYWEVVGPLRGSYLIAGTALGRD